MDLSKVFDCMPHNMLIAEIHAYGFSQDCLTFFYLFEKEKIKY